MRFFGRPSLRKQLRGKTGAVWMACIISTMRNLKHSPISIKLSCVKLLGQGTSICAIIRDGGERDCSNPHSILMWRNKQVAISLFRFMNMAAARSRGTSFLRGVTDLGYETKLIMWI